MLRLPSATPLTIFKNDSHKMFLVKKISKKRKIGQRHQKSNCWNELLPTSVSFKHHGD